MHFLVFNSYFLRAHFPRSAAQLDFPTPLAWGKKNPRFVSIKVFLQRPGNVEKKLNVIYCFPDAAFPRSELKAELRGGLTSNPATTLLIKVGSNCPLLGMLFQVISLLLPRPVKSMVAELKPYQLLFYQPTDKIKDSRSTKELLRLLAIAWLELTSTMC